VAAPDYATVAVDGARFEPVAGGENLLRPVYRDGALLIDESLSTIRARAGAT
jgi:nicotinamide phosphoribosyltransferase